MIKTHIAYDSRSGRIISVLHGERDPKRARERAQHYTGIDSRHIGMITVESESVERGKRYKVDVARKALVEDAIEGIGFSFSVGIVAQSS